MSTIYLYFANTGSLTLEIYKNGEKLDDDYDINIDSTSVKFDLPSPLILPITENGVRNEYHFLYAPGSLQPMNNKTSCGCSGIESNRKKFLTPVGVIGTDIDNLSTNSNFAYGLSLEVVVSCSIDNIICEFMIDTVFERRFAMAQWYKMGVLIIEALFASREINFDTFTDREYLYGRRSKFDKQYRNLVLWLSENTTINQSNCFVCDSTKVMKMGKNLI